jgi:hypothetical protein
MTLSSRDRLEGSPAPFAEDRGPNGFVPAAADPVRRPPFTIDGRCGPKI